MNPKTPFPNPLQLGVVDHFAHPREGHRYEFAGYHEGEAIVANGYMAFRFSRGMWHPSDFPRPRTGFLERFEALPWSRFAGIPDEWRAMDDVRGNLYRYAPICPWTDNGRCAPSPVWRVNGSFLARLSHLQLIARLPRCEVHLGVMAPDAPLLVRCTGGIGMLMPDTKLTLSSFSIFEPRRHDDGSRIGKRPAMTGNLGKPPKPDPGPPDWPPAEADFS